MEAKLVRKLETLKNRSTLYEIIAKRGSEKILIMYGPKSKRQILNGLSDDNHRRLYALAKTTATMPEDWRVSKAGITNGNWSIVPSGRTQREAYIEGELLSIYEY